MLDVSPARPVRVTGVQETDIPAILTLFERVFGNEQDLRVTFNAEGFEISIPALPAGETWRSAQWLHEIVGFLRSPQGCPWDRAQDLQSLAPKALEEAYEVVDAIHEGDPAELAGELGDLLLIVALLTQMAEEMGAFTIEDVYELVNRKLIRRHPHVFGDDAADTPEAVLSTWQRIKQAERGESTKPQSRYDRLPKSMPAIAKAAVMQEETMAVPSERALPNGQELLALIEAMMVAGRDPEAELQAALDRKYQTT